MLDQKASEQHLGEEPSFPNTMVPKLKKSWSGIFTSTSALVSEWPSEIFLATLYLLLPTTNMQWHKKLSSSSRSHPYTSKIYKLKNELARHLEAVRHCGEKRGAWRKEEEWIGPTEFYHHFAKTDLNTLNSLKSDCVERIVLLLNSLNSLKSDCVECIVLLLKTSLILNIPFL